jgi:hypothetical protein
MALIISDVDAFFYRLYSHFGPPPTPTLPLRGRGNACGRERLQYIDRLVRIQLGPLMRELST